MLNGVNGPLAAAEKRKEKSIPPFVLSSWQDQWQLNGSTNGLRRTESSAHRTT